ncbi:magnesium-translocating P-type ATPase [Galactobacter sp.]|uniref:magnesium-translocating P-type ATPase n=1 Tax=Galactobacter sp. TaxID=2676125 RepID=UPI0025BD8705|nr:magnesium-translocating P-type ATPase [Galactobacter sp.]
MTTTREPAPLHTRTADDVLRCLGSSTTGLSSEAAAAALPATRARAVTNRSSHNGWALLAHQFTSPIMLVLIAATVLSGVLGDWLDATIILVIVLLSGVLDFAQERGAANSMSALLAGTKLQATTFRDGKPLEVDFDAVVPGDVIRVSGGDLLPADAMVLSSHDLELDQAELTGETYPVTKTPGPVPENTAMAERSNLLYSGTHVASGHGTAVVVATGRDTQFGQVSASLTAKRKPTGFERGMTRFGLLLTRIMVVLVVVIFVVNLVLRRPLVDSALFSLSLAVGLTPQLLPAIVGLSLARGARTIAAHHVIVKRLNAIEDFGAMTVLCTDKTGTMTEGLIRLSAPINVLGEPEPRLLATAALNATLQRGLINPMDRAIAQAASAAGLDTNGARAVGEVPYDFQRKLLSVAVASAEPIWPLPHATAMPDAVGSASAVMVTKGAFDAVVLRCAHAVGEDGAVVDLDTMLPEANRTVEHLGAQGVRVLAVAVKEVQDPDIAVEDEAGMTLIGLLTFADPIKEDAAGTIEAFNDAGVAVKMITGDAHPVARHAAGALGLDPEAILTGTELDGIGEEELPSRAASTDVFCETSPAHKHRIIEALGRAGHTVGYMGDGINDAPALKAADVGISVQGAADVAAESASLVMTEKDLGVLRQAMLAGRATFANTMKYIQMTTSANVGNMISMAVASVVLPFLPLLAAQILVINLLTDLPATAIATDRVDAKQLAHPQRWDLRLIRNYMLVFGVLSSCFDLFTFWILRAGFHSGEQEFQAAWFLGSVLTEVLVLFSLRTRGPLWRSKPSRILVLLGALVAALAFLLTLTPVGALLRLSIPPLNLVGLIVAVAVAYVAANEAIKALFWRVPSHRHPGARGKTSIG